MRATLMIPVRLQRVLPAQRYRGRPPFPVAEVLKFRGEVHAVVTASKSQSVGPRCSGRRHFTAGNEARPGIGRGRNDAGDQLASLGHFDDLAGGYSVEVLAGVLPQLAAAAPFHVVHCSTSGGGGTGLQRCATCARSRLAELKIAPARRPGTADDKHKCDDTSTQLSAVFCNELQPPASVRTWG